MWSNRETSELYEHLSVPANSFIEKIVSDAIDDMNSKPELWSDYARQAIRVLASNLRAHVEGMFEDFYFGPAEKRTHTLALMCSEVGSLWRVNWTEIAEQMFEDREYQLEPPE
jgi:hypothetical protein